MHLLSSSPALFSARTTTIPSQKKVSIPPNRLQSAKPVFASSDTLSLGHSNPQPTQLQNHPSFLIKTAINPASTPTNFFHPLAASLQKNRPSLHFGNSDSEAELDEDFGEDEDDDVDQLGESVSSLRLAPASTGAASGSLQNFEVTDRGLKKLKKYYPPELWRMLQQIPKNERKNIYILDIGSGKGKFVRDLKKLGYTNATGINNQVVDPHNPNVMAIDLDEMPIDTFDNEYHLITSSFSVFAPIYNNLVSTQKKADYLTKMANWLVPGGSIFLVPVDTRKIYEILELEKQSNPDSPINDLYVKTWDDTEAVDDSGFPMQWIQLCKYDPKKEKTAASASKTAVSTKGKETTGSSTSYSKHHTSSSYSKPSKPPHKDESSAYKQQPSHHTTKRHKHTQSSPATGASSKPAVTLLETIPGEDDYGVTYRYKYSDGSSAFEGYDDDGWYINYFNKKGKLTGFDR